MENGNGRLGDRIARIKERVDPVAHLEQWATVRSSKACCPIPDHGGENTPSFHVYDNAAAPYHCFGCGWRGDVIDLHRAITGDDLKAAIDALDNEAIMQAPKADRPKVRDAWTVVDPVPADAPPLVDDDGTARVWSPRDGRWKTWPVVTAYAYRTADGQLRGFEVRMEFTKDGKQKKMTPPVTWCTRADGSDARWVSRGWPTPTPLFGVESMAGSDEVVLICEGPKSAVAAHALTGQPAVTSAFGSQSPHMADWSPLAGRRCVIWEDHDEPGRKYGAEVARLVTAVGGQVLGHIDHRGLSASLGRSIGAGDDAADVTAEEAERIGLTTLIADGSLVVAPPEPPPLPEQAQHQSGDVPKAVALRQRMIADMEEYLETIDLAPDAMDGWRRRSTWGLVDADVGRLANDFWERACSRSYCIALDTVRSTLEARSRRARVARRTDMVADLAESPGCDEGRHALREWCAVVAVDGPASVDRPADMPEMSMIDLAYYGMLHWVRNVKRLALGMQAERDIMPVLHGAQGSGKSTATALLARPWHELVIDIEADHLTDDRRARVLATAVIGRWEEMQGAARSDVEALKHTITTNTVGYRPMRTNDLVTLPRTCAFIGTSNLRVAQLVADTTGARRFLEIRGPDRLDWARLNAIDPHMLWQSIGAEDPSPLLPYLDALERHQEELVHVDPISLWLQSEPWGRLLLMMADCETPEIIAPYDPGQGSLFDDMAMRFAHWCRSVGQTPLGVKTLAQRLDQEGFTWRRMVVDGRRERRYFVPDRHLSARRQVGSPPIAAPSPAPAPPPDDPVAGRIDDEPLF